MVKKINLIYLLICIALLTACSPNGKEISPQRPETKSEITPVEVEPAPPITLSFAGDTMATGKVAGYVKDYGFQYPWQEAKPYLEESDIAMLNLETAVSGKGEASTKKYAFNSHPDLIKGMEWAGVDIVTVANNHSLDYGTEAFIDTLENLSKEGISYVGGGANEAEAYQAKQMTVKGKDISFLGFSRVLPAVSWYATKNQPGLASGYQKERVYEIAAEAVENSDITIVYMHWGKELADTPELEEKEMAHHLIDIGVDVVIGAHSHVLQGLEYYNGKLIAYSLGNFVFTSSHQDIARQSAVLQVAIHEDGAQSARVVPMKIDKGAVWIANEEEKLKVMNRLSSLSVGGEWTESGEYYPTK